MEPKQGAGPELSLELNELISRRDELTHRLRNGQGKIATARRQGRAAETVKSAEEKWLGLLREYEEVEDRIRALKAGSDPDSGQ